MKMSKIHRYDLAPVRAQRGKIRTLYTYPMTGGTALAHLCTAHVRSAQLRLETEPGMRREVLLFSGALVLDDGSGQPRVLRDRDRMQCAGGSALAGFGLAYQMELLCTEDCRSALYLTETGEGTSAMQTVDAHMVKVLYVLRGLTEVVGADGQRAILEPGDVLAVETEEGAETLQIAGADCQIAVADLWTPAAQGIQAESAAC